MTRIRAVILLILSGLGAAVSLFLVWQHIAFERGSELAEIGCSFTQTFDCGAVQESAFSSIAGIPTASFGALFFIVFFGFLLTVVKASPEQAAREDNRSVACLFSLIGLATCAFFASISAFVIRSFCIGCTAVYLISVAMAAVLMGRRPGDYLRDALRGPGAALRGLKGLIPRDGVFEPSLGRKFGLVVLLLVSPALFAVPPWLVVEARREKLESTRQQLLAETSDVVEVRDYTFTRGNPEAAVRIAFISDLECPYCVKASKAIKDVLSRYSEEDYYLIYKHFPLDVACNPTMQRNIGHDQACRLAWLSQALDEEKFWEVLPDLYEMEHISQLERIAEKHGIDFEDWIQRSDRKEIREQVQADIEEIAGFPVHSVPQIYINGLRISNDSGIIVAALQTAFEQQNVQPEKSATQAAE